MYSTQSYPALRWSMSSSENTCFISPWRMCYISLCNTPYSPMSHTDFHVNLTCNPLEQLLVVSQRWNIAGQLDIHGPSVHLSLLVHRTVCVRQTFLASFICPFVFPSVQVCSCLFECAQMILWSYPLHNTMNLNSDYDNINILCQTNIYTYLIMWKHI